MTGAGIGFSCDVPALFMYDTTFRGNFFAQGAAIATILLIFVAILIIPYLRHGLRREAKIRSVHKSVELFYTWF